MIDIEALAAPAFLVEISALGSPGATRLNAAGRAHPALVRGLLSGPVERDPQGRGCGDGLARALRDCAHGRTATEMSLPGTGLATAGGWQASLSPLVDRDGRLTALLGICWEDRGAGRSRAPACDHLSLALQALHGAEWRYDVGRGVYEGSDEIATLFGEDVPRPVAWGEWLERVHPQDLAAFIARPAPDGATEFRFRAVCGELRWARCTRVALTDEAGEIEAVLGIMVDITQERARETAWAELATHDPLTGLLNRRGLRQEIDRLQGERHPAPLPRGTGQGCPGAPTRPCLALFAVDLDHFKQTNDAHGHAAGDAVLVEASRRLAGAVEGGICARLGGDEFVAVLPVSGDVEAREIRARLQQGFRRPLGFRGNWLPVSASVGVACASGRVDAARLMDEADADLYARKRGRVGAAAA